MSSLRVAVLASGRGSNLQAIIDNINEGKLNVSLEVVVSDKKDAQALTRAAEQGVDNFWVNPKEYINKEAFETALINIIKQYKVDYLVLAGFMRIFSPHFIRNVGVPVLNIHPSLLPSFPGLHAQRQAIDYGVRYSGCTVHFIDEGVDSGPIILQAVVPVYSWDTEDTLAQRILQEEHLLYPRALQLLSEGKAICEGRKVKIIGEGENDE